MSSFNITNQPLGFDLKTGYLFRAVDKSNGMVLKKNLTSVLGVPDDVSQGHIGWSSIQIGHEYTQLGLHLPCPVAQN